MLSLTLTVIPATAAQVLTAQMWVYLPCKTETCQRTAVPYSWESYEVSGPGDVETYKCRNFTDVLADNIVVNSARVQHVDTHVKRRFGSKNLFYVANWFDGVTDCSNEYVYQFGYAVEQTQKDYKSAPCESMYYGKTIKTPGGLQGKYYKDAKCTKTTGPTWRYRFGCNRVPGRNASVFLSLVGKPFSIKVDDVENN